MSVKIFPFSNGVLDALETSLSPERVATYASAVGGDREKALRLYTWNTAVSAAFYGPLQGLEVALRNAMHSQLSGCYGLDWYDNPACDLDGMTMNRIDEAKGKLQRGGYAIDPPHMVAELSFGFWVSLLGSGGYPRGPRGQKKKNYEMTLWRPALYKAFPNARMKRTQVHQPLDYLRTFRNRIAHHEPIFNRHLQKDYDSILMITGWICSRTTDWIKHHSRVDQILQQDRYRGEVLF